MNDSGQMMPYQELWERLKQVTGERNRLEAELAALEANPLLAEVEGRAWVWRDGVILFETSGNLSLIRDADPHSYDGNAVDVTVTIRGR